MTSCAWSDADESLLDEIYKLEKLSRMNSIYYELRLSRVKKISFWMEVSIATTASGSGLASLLAHGQGYVGWMGQYIWPVIAIIAATAAIIRPIYGPGRMIEAYVRQHQGYQGNYFSLRKLALEVRQEGKISEGHRRAYFSHYERHVQLSEAKLAEDEAAPSDKVRNEAMRRADEELPREKFWWPGEAYPG